jgi:hypothetical protein
VPEGVWTYEYDKNNRIEEENYYWKNRKIDTTQWVYKYHGDSVTIVHQYDKTYKHLYYKYKQKGSCEYLSTANSDSTNFTKGLFVYDRYNRIVRKEKYENKKYVQFLRTYTYRDTIERGPSVKIWFFTWHTRHNSSPRISTHKYDNFGNEIESSGVGEFSRTHITEYIYDKYNNWIERKVHLYNGRIKISKRTYDYWE